MKGNCISLKCDKKLLRVVLTEAGLLCGGSICFGINEDNGPWILTAIGRKDGDYGVMFGLSERTDSEYFSTRNIVGTKEEFLAGVAKMSGKIYIPNQKKQEEMDTKQEMEKIIIGGIEIKPGMLVYLDYTDIRSRNYFIVFPKRNKLSIVSYEGCRWEYLSDFKDKVTAIKDDSETHYHLSNGELLWQKPKKITVTKQQIAEKFGIDVEQLEIIE